VTHSDVCVVIDDTGRKSVLSSMAAVYGRQIHFVRPGVNFINVLLTALTHTDPKSVKKTVKLSIFFTLLGSTREKALCKMWVKLTPFMFLQLGLVNIWQKEIVH